MKQHRIYTSAEIKEIKFVEEQCRYRIFLINEFLNTCHLTIGDLCAHLDINESTFYRYKNNTSHISMNKYLCACNFCQLYMEEHKIPYTEKLIDMIRRTDIFSHQQNSDKV